MNNMFIYIVWMISSLSSLMFFWVTMEKKYSAWKVIIYFEVINAFCSLVKLYFYMILRDKAFDFMVMLVFITYLASVHICFKGSIIKKFFYLLIHHAALCICEVVAGSVLIQIFNEEYEFIFQTSLFPYTAIITIFFSSIILYGVAVSLRNFDTKCYLDRDWYFMVLPVGLLLSFTPKSFHIAQNGMGMDLWNMFGASVAIIFIISIPIIMSETAERETAEIKLKQLQWQYEMENAYYELLETKQKEVRKMEHDFNNQLSIVIGLVEKGEEEEAISLLAEIRDQFC